MIDLLYDNKVERFRSPKLLVERIYSLYKGDKKVIQVTNAKHLRGIRFSGKRFRAGEEDQYRAVADLLDAFSKDKQPETARDEVLAKL